MAEKYALSQASATSLAGVLGLGQAAASAGESADVYNLLAASMCQMTAAIKEIQQKLPDQPALQAVTALDLVVKEVNLCCYKSTQRAQNKSLVPSDRPLLTTLYEVGITTSVTENDAKGVTPFTNTEAEAELVCESFLQDVVTLAKSKNLTEEAFKHLLYKKLQTSARALYDSHLDLHGIKYKDISMIEAVQLAEFLFMKTANPRAALVSLARVPKLPAHDKNFYKLQAHISRLAKISVLDEIKAVREVLYQTRCLSAFCSSITVGDRAALEAANTERVAANLHPFNMSGAIQYLLQKYQDLNVEVAAPVHYTHLESGLSTMRAIQEGELANYSPQTAWVARGGARGRAGRGRDNFQNKPAGAGQMRAGVQYQERSPGGGNLNGSPAPWRKPADLILDAKILNIPVNSCWGCGSQSHSFYERACPFYGTQLFPKPCRWCGKGAHSHTLCPRAQNGPNQAPRGRAAGRSTNRGAGPWNRAPGADRRHGKTGPQARLANQTGALGNYELEQMNEEPVLEDPYLWMFSGEKNEQ